MARNAFYSFHYEPDCWRASQVRNMGVVDGNHPVNDNDWETVKRGGDPAIQRWIDGQMQGRSCVVVLVGSGTAGRKWINYEIKRGWELGKGVVGIRVHGLQNAAGYTSTAGANPFSSVVVGGRLMSSLATLYDPAGFDSKTKYQSIKSGIGSWIEQAIRTRSLS